MRELPLRILHLAPGNLNSVPRVVLVLVLWEDGVSELPHHPDAHLGEEGKEGGGMAGVSHIYGRGQEGQRGAVECTESPTMPS